MTPEDYRSCGPLAPETPRDTETVPGNCVSNGAAGRRLWPWLVVGMMLVAGMGVCVWANVNDFASAKVLVLAGAGMGGLFLCLLVLRPTHVSGGVWAVMIVVAVMMRLPWFFVPPSVSGDYHRYLWDGAVTAHGISPYVHTPKDVLDNHVDDPTLDKLARSGRFVLEGINHPKLRTIYPPVAQGAFALAYWITPFSLNAWRIVLLAFDIAAALAVLGLLRSAGLPLLLVFVYLWNPLLVTETYSGGHVDLLAAAMVVLFAWALTTKRPIIAGCALALAIGVKLWPVLLLPFLLRSLWGHWRRMTVTIGILATMLVLMAVPFASAFGAEADSGLLTYARTWSAQPGAYLAFDKLGLWLRGRLSLTMDNHYIGRSLMMLVLLSLAAWLGLRRPSDASVLCRRMGLVIMLMLLLSPALWSWYYIAVIPLAAIASPRLGLLLWTALLPLIYLEGDVLSGEHLTWFVHLLAWLVLAAEWAWPHLAERMRREHTHA
ncbi:hypothetical protein LCGC14_0253750 [marine sediment metagenome]|uniref:DUF2029 domain-containing protein n=1 Tax=marine sediment metagenome TaxID=412755 RepID=A0A0F9U8D1_9ZZZZ|nr:DUF2029 domain-containing protein [Phycisphaerae bacterium]HDZ45184.1 DUF2029 domain-containing protein [Phycisphaerae bacterium]